MTLEKSSKLTICLTLLVLTLWLPWFAGHQYPTKSDMAAAFAGSMGFFLGILFFMVSSLPSKHDLKITIPPLTQKYLRDVQRYLEHTDILETIKKSLIYYCALLHAVKEDQGKVILKFKDGSEISADPVSFEIPPVEGDDDDLEESSDETY